MLDIEENEIVIFVLSVLLGVGIFLLVGLETGVIVGAVILVTLAWLGLHWIKDRVTTKLLYGRWFF